MYEKETEQLQEIIDDSRRIVFFGGAGVSTESGIPDFRSADGIYHQKYKYSEDYLKNLKILEYDILYGNHEIYGGENPYKATDMVMGTDEIKITKAYAYGDHVCVEGENFNDFSVVLVNEKEYPTVIVNGNMLTAEGVKLKAGDKVSVIQRGKDKIELSRVTLELTVDNTKP